MAKYKVVIDEITSIVLHEAIHGNRSLMVKDGLNTYKCSTKKDDIKKISVNHNTLEMCLLYVKKGKRKTGLSQNALTLWEQTLRDPLRGFGRVFPGFLRTRSGCGMLNRLETFVFGL